MRCLREKVPVEQGRPAGYRPEPVQMPPRPPQIPQAPPVQLPPNVVAKAKELRGSLEGILLDQSMNELAKLPVSELASKLVDYQGVDTIVFDGVVTQRLLDLAEERGVKIGRRRSHCRTDSETGLNQDNDSAGSCRCTLNSQLPLVHTE